MNEVNEGAQDTGNEAEEYVELHEASEEDINAFLENAENADLEAAPPAEQNEKAPEDKTEEEKPDEAKAEQDLAAKQEALARQLQGLELLMKRRTSEIAALKKQLAEYAQANREGLDELYLESPSEAVERTLRAKQAEAQIAQLSQEEQQLVQSQQAQALLNHYVGPDGFDGEGIAQVLRDDGLPEDFVQRFVQNPYTAALPETLIHLAKRAKERRELVTVKSQAQELAMYVQRLMEEQKQAPNKVLSNIQNAMKAGPSISGTSGGVGGVRGVNQNDLASLSDAELNELLGV